MYICVCRALSEGDLKSIVEAQGPDLEKVQRTCGAATDCGSCQERVESLVKGFGKRQELATTSSKK